MAGFNNYQNYGNFGAYNGVGFGNNFSGNAVGAPSPAPAPIPMRPMQNGNNFNSFSQNTTQVLDNRWVFTDYVSGRPGADAYQLPNGVERVILFDNDTNRMFVKGYDNTGRPRVFEDNDFQPHVEPEPQASPVGVDLSSYATKDDIQQMINNALGNIKSPNLSHYVTQKDLTKALSELSVGNGGRIVRNNESNA